MKFQKTIFNGCRVSIERANRDESLSSVIVTASHMKCSLDCIMYKLSIAGT